MALSAIATEEQLAGLAVHDSKHVRLAAVVALRRLESAALQGFLQDAENDVVVEAAIAIHDLPIAEAMPALAALVTQSSDVDALNRRVLNANFRLGTRDNARSLAAYAADPNRPLAMRREALEMLEDWESPKGRDRVLGMWRPLEARDGSAVRNALATVLPKFEDAEASLQLGLGRIAVKYQIPAAAPILRAILAGSKSRSKDRASALVALVGLEAATADELQLALDDASTDVRAAALSVIRRVLPEAADQRLAQAALQGEILERQIAIDALGDTETASPQLLEVLRQWANGGLPQDVQLEALQAAEKFRELPAVKAVLAKVNATRDPSKPADLYRETLRGGDVGRGRSIFFEKVAVSCVRCHKVGALGGEVGPDLTRIGVDKDRQYLLEAIVEPNKVIAKGFESAILLDLDGNIHTGVVREEDENSITLIDADGKVTSYDKEDIEARNPAKSAMPADLVNLLSKRELRDLIEYLANLDGRFVPQEREVQ